MKPDKVDALASHIHERGYDGSQLQLCRVGQDSARTLSVLGRAMEHYQLTAPEADRLREEVKEDGTVWFHAPDTVHCMTLPPVVMDFYGLNESLGDQLLIGGHRASWCVHAERGAPPGVLASAIRLQLDPSRTDG